MEKITINPADGRLCSELTFRRLIIDEHNKLVELYNKMLKEVEKLGKIEAKVAELKWRADNPGMRPEIPDDEIEKTKKNTKHKD